VSAFLARADVMEVFQPGDHGSTFGGNPLGAAVGRAALKMLVDDRLSERAAQMGVLLSEGLAQLESPMIRDIRGKGLLWGVDLDPRYAGARKTCETLLRHGILSKDTHETVVRFAPPLVISAEQIASALVAIGQAFGELTRCAGDERSVKAEPVCPKPCQTSALRREVLNWAIAGHKIAREPVQGIALERIILRCTILIGKIAHDS
jgi:hypothetical protein